MTASSFDEALKRVLVHEGGYANHPADPGGATMKGVTQRVYDGWRRRKGTVTRSVRLIEAVEVRAIYRKQYWDGVRADEPPTGLDYCVFDAAVNSGVGQAVKWLQRALGVAADGQIGEVTLAALNGRPVVPLIEGVCDRRLAMLKWLTTFRTFGAGWLRRVGEVREVAIRMARGGPDRAMPRATFPTSSEIAKAQPSDIRLDRTPEGAGGLMAGAGGVASIVAEQADRLAPLAGFAEPLKWVFVVLMLAGIALTLHGALARIRAGEAVQ
ncbi:glycoside hydrolase family 108 protein [Ancylobacter pratisalsi]|uniref:Glycoside hydrolase family 108 protein n=1 Tax=Ancylobacter pratisalsi TaxID=1745854 RepID=A0A6P1YNS1_9HYPH|nr:glycoside hydrolase family 108 protein [Ancylobacter pratisalsi]QIB35107.1 glycoside hydrolase family 108 protein [Ancylobacter pratisalsi]